MSAWDQPQDVTDLQIAFPADVVGTLLPTVDELGGYSAISFNNETAATRWVERWFSCGLQGFPPAREGVDGKKALRHLKAVLGSWEPKHEHKIAGVAFLAEKWLDLSRTPEAKKAGSER